MFPHHVPLRSLITLTLLLAFALSPGIGFTSMEGKAAAASVNDDYPVPAEVTLCGERMPLENRQVWERLDREITIASWDRAQVFMWVKRTGRFFPYIERSLAEAGLPDDLKYLAVAESSLITDISSNRSALGLWQFMPGTARQNGLKKNRNVDERLNFELSTKAALKYLKRLRSVFGSWTLALAAYNCGEARLKNEIKEQEVHDFYDLYLPNETERFIFRIAAIKIIMKNPERYGFHLSPDRIYKPIQAEKMKVNLRSPLHLTKVAKALGTNYKVIKDLNPHILGRYLPVGKYEIWVPQGRSSKLAASLKKLSKVSPKSKRPRGGNRFYVVKRGDTLSGVSLKTGVSMAIIRRLNRLEDTRIFVGQKLRLTP